MSAFPIHSRIFTHNGCTVTVCDFEHWVETAWRTWAGAWTLLAKPEYTGEYVQRARALGYTGTDVDAAWAMCREHDLLHAWLVAALGRPHSPTLWALAQGTTPDPDVCGFEEDLALAFAKYLNRGEMSGPLRILKFYGHDLGELKARWAALLGGTGEGAG